MALKFAKQHKDRLRYVAAWNHWMKWEKTCWRRDETKHVFDKVRKTCRQASTECNKPKTSTVLASAKTVAAVERLSSLTG